VSCGSQLPFLPLIWGWDDLSMKKCGPGGRPARGARPALVMEGILLGTMFDLPSLEDVEGVVITKRVVEGTAPPLHVYPDRSDRTSDAGA
jgi:ATP-dependent protease Clp ATPase subunit